ncbi:hypothetical protein L5149_004211 [Vibrio vulnificus]|nr:hypothetical protein [Vibrio vulnificus]
MSLAICLRFSANQLHLSQFFVISNISTNQNPWIASFKNRAGRLKVSLAQSRFDLINGIDLTVCFKLVAFGGQIEGNAWNWFNAMR